MHVIQLAVLLICGSLGNTYAVRDAFFGKSFPTTGSRSTQISRPSARRLSDDDCFDILKPHVKKVMRPADVFLGRNFAVIIMVDSHLVGNFLKLLGCHLCCANGLEYLSEIVHDLSTCKLTCRA